MTRLLDRPFGMGLVMIVAAGLMSPAISKGQSEDSSRRERKLPGIHAVLGIPEDGGATAVIDWASAESQTVYFQSDDEQEVSSLREAAAKAGLLGRSLFVDQGDWASIHLADNLADRVTVSPTAAESLPRKEVMRIARPAAKILLPDGEVSKPRPGDWDDWSHPYHGPDNNPQSNDKHIVAPYLTQFMAQPLFSPMPVVTVSAGGRIFRAHGHIAHKANQNAWLNTLVGMNAYNGTILWRRPLPKGFMIHRNTMIATPNVLYLADDQSCQCIDTATGETVDEIVIPDGLSDGPVWKWMALHDGVLYALIGATESPVHTQSSRTLGLGHWPWGMWEGHEYADPEHSFGFGRTFVAIDVETKQLVWSHSEGEFIDSRGVCMGSKGIYFYGPEKLVGCLDPSTGEPKWKTESEDLLQAIGPNGRAQHYITGYATSAYIKCNDQYIFFAGPQRERLVVASAADGSLLWTREGGNLQLVLRDDGFYAAGPQDGGAGWKLDYETGKVLAVLPQRRACTRATGTSDSIFFRASGGTVRIVTEDNSAEHITPMRPPCQDGVVVANGMLYWGPWMCGCQLSAYGHIGVAAAGDFDFHPGTETSRMEYADHDLQAIQPLDIRDGDWPASCGDSQRSCRAHVSLPSATRVLWSSTITPDVIPTAPVTAGGLVFAGDRSGVLRAWDADSGQVQWQAYTAGPIFGAPAIDAGRIFVGSGDGRVYAFEAKSGRLLWRFRAAPANRWIPVYGQLMSTWPVAGGVVVHDGVLYAAAGIHHYDGIHVYALNPEDGRVLWYNDSSGMTSKQFKSGVNLQGELFIRDKELRFLGGGVHELARYELETGKCLNMPNSGPYSKFPTAYYAYYPDYGKFRSLDYALDDGQRLAYDASYEGSIHGPLRLLPANANRPTMLESRWGNLRGRGGRASADNIWLDTSGRRFTSFAATDQRLLAAGETGDPASPRSFIGAVDVSDGKETWTRGLPATVVPGGIALNAQGLVFVTLENGQLLSLASD